EVPADGHARSDRGRTTPQQPRCRPHHPPFVATVTDTVLTTLSDHHQEAGRTGHTPGTRDAHGEPPQESQIKAGVAPTT
ncbi:MAG: hypothetical protein WBF75_15910, partial [Pseudonocardiaceae bacterium]